MAWQDGRGNGTYDGRIRSMRFLVYNSTSVGYKEFQGTSGVATIATKGKQLFICESIADREIADFSFVNGEVTLLLVLAYFQLHAMSTRYTRRQAQHEPC
jgi:hypothetical protein